MMMGPAIRRDERTVWNITKLLLVICLAISMTTAFVPVVSGQVPPENFLQYSAAAERTTAPGEFPGEFKVTLTVENCQESVCAGVDAMNSAVLKILDTSGQAVQLRSDRATVKVVSTSLQKNWKATVTDDGNSTTVTLKAETLLDGLTANESVSVTLEDPKFPGTYTIDTTAKDSTGLVTLKQSGDDPQFTTATVFPCDMSCEGSVTSSDKSTTTTVKVSGADDNSSLRITMLDPKKFPPPNGACTGFTARGFGSAIEVTPEKTPTEATKVITWRLDKLAVNQQPKSGAGQFDICLGSKNTDSTKQNPPFPTKTGTTAFFDEQRGLWWGLLPACTTKTPADPCIQSQHKTNAGDIVITFIVPAPWDEDFYGG